MTTTPITYQCAECGEPLQIEEGFPHEGSFVVSLRPCATCRLALIEKMRDMVDEHMTEAVK